MITDVRRCVIENLLRDDWKELDSAELRILLNERIGRPGQYQNRLKNPNKFYLPLAGASCRIALTFNGNKIIRMEPGEAFDRSEWERVSAEIEKLIRAGPTKVGREFSFSSFRVTGSWRGEHSGIQILPPPDDAPHPVIESGENPFILEFPIKDFDVWQVVNHRRMRDHRNLTLLLNILLAGRTSLQPRRPEHFWAGIPSDTGMGVEIKWVQQFFFAKLGECVIEELSSPVANQLEEIEPEEYYTEVGHDGRPLRIPADLDHSICCYTELSAKNREKFDRAIFWIDLASRQWNVSVSASFAALVSAVESLTERGSRHQFDCPICGKTADHEVPGAIRRFKDFFEIYAPGEGTLAKQRTDMYSLRSGILHGSQLMQFDQDLPFGSWDPPHLNERELHQELWSVMRIAVRNWLKAPPA